MKAINSNADQFINLLIILAGMSSAVSGAVFALTNILS